MAGGFGRVRGPRGVSDSQGPRHVSTVHPSRRPLRPSAPSSGPFPPPAPSSRRPLRPSDGVLIFGKTARVLRRD